ncbi:MAG: hypothetical protein U0572_04705 [Phycisphaerales bacterium]
MTKRQLASVATLVAFVLPLAACDERVQRPAQPGPQAPKSETVVSGGGSALGKAKNSAERLQDKVDDHNREIEKAAEDINNNK